MMLPGLECCSKPEEMFHVAKGTGKKILVYK
jgi:hypothetical protein